MKTTKVLLSLLAFMLIGVVQGYSQAPNNAYGDNQVQVEPGVFAIYSGDVNQDGFIGSDDVAIIDTDNLNGVFGGYFVTDLNGDAFVGSDDVGIADNNNILGIFVLTP